MDAAFGILMRPLSMELVIPLSKTGEPFFRQIYKGMRQAILTGALPAGNRLPSTRDLAEQLGVSRTVVLLAYNQLLDEGFAAGRGGSGTFVPEGLGRSAPKRQRRAAKLRLSRYGYAAAEAGESVDSPRPSPLPVRYDFAFGRSAIDSFPLEYWRRTLLRHVRQAPVRAFEYGQAAGSLVLREAICAHLGRSRAVVCDPSEVIVVNGSQQAIDLVARVLVERGDRVAIEDPQYNGAREVLRAAGAQLLPVPVDCDGLNPAKLPKQAGLVFVTPSHQFPTGAILPLARRIALLDWARRKNSIIVENDHDGEFRYEGRPVESLQGLDTEGRIVYLGTFSRAIFPALRIGYLIVPKSLAPTFIAAKWLNDLHSPTLEQEALAEFINSGMYERHLRRLRRRNAARRAALLDAVHRYLGNRVEVTGDGSGAHIVLWPVKQVSESAIIAQAASRGVGVYGISHCYLTKPSRTGFIIGYSRMNEEPIREGIRLLSEVL
jgi:GntR family transcriptional regulator/MocR family aminotransferase